MGIFKPFTVSDFKCSSSFPLPLLRFLMKRLPNSPFHAILAVSVVAACVAAWSCQQQITDPSQIVIPASNVSFERNLLPLFNLTCNAAGCHSSDSRAGGVALTSYFEVVFNRPGLVIAGKPEQSLLAQIMDIANAGRPPHLQSFQNRITQNHINGVKTWIREGAK
jgi:hypothetical protein